MEMVERRCVSTSSVSARHARRYRVEHQRSTTEAVVAALLLLPFSRCRELLGFCRRHRRGAALTAIVGMGAAVALFQSFDIPRIVGELWKPPLRNTKSGGPPRIALCFYGLTRSLRWTLPSVKSRVLDVLRDDGMEVDVFVHTYHLREVNNERAGERGINYKSYVADYLALNATRSLVTEQDDFDLAWPDPFSLTHYRWSYPPETVSGVVRNVFRAYWSMSMAWGLVAEYATEEDFEYDAVMLARPDVWYHVDVDLPRRSFPLPEQTVFVPSFDATRGGPRVNDRFAYGSVDTMRVVMHRLATFMDAGVGKHNNVDSEWVLGHHLRSHNVSVTTLKFPLTRIRLNGAIPSFDQRRVHDACKGTRGGSDPELCAMVRQEYKFLAGHKESPPATSREARPSNATTRV